MASEQPRSISSAELTQLFLKTHASSFTISDLLKGKDQLGQPDQQDERSRLQKALVGKLEVEMDSIHVWFLHVFGNRVPFQEFVDRLPGIEGVQTEILERLQRLASADARTQTAHGDRASTVLEMVTTFQKREDNRRKERGLRDKRPARWNRAGYEALPESPEKPEQGFLAKLRRWFRKK